LHGVNGGSVLEMAHEHCGAVRRERTLESAFGANAGRISIVAALKPWFEKQLSMISNGSTLAEDIR